MSVLEKKITFGLIVGSRSFFDGTLALNARRQLIAQLDRLGIGYHILPVSETPNGAVESAGDIGKYVRLFREKRDDIDGIVVVLPNFGDEIAVTETVHRAALNVPVLVQACRDDIEPGGAITRRDAFCGKLSVCNNFHQYGIPFTDTTSHTCAIDSAAFGEDLDRFARLCRTVKGLRGARIGCVGARTAPFQTVRYSEKLLQASGITVIPVDLSEILAVLETMRDDDPAVRARIAQIGDYGNIAPMTPPTSVAKSAKLSLALERWIAENECDASALQCWSSIQNNFGCGTCLSMSLMGENLLPSACETDVVGAVSMYALTLAAKTPSALMDWNNNYEDSPDLCVCMHCGNHPKGFLGVKPDISTLGVLATQLGADKCFGAVKGRAAAGPLTYFRVSTDDRAGTIRAYIGEGAITDDPLTMDAGFAVVRVPQLDRLMKYLCRNGFEHHVAMVRGTYASVIEEATSRYLGWQVYHHR